MSACTWQKCVERWCHSPPLLSVITMRLGIRLPSSGETPNKFVRCRPWCLLPLNEWPGRWYNKICSQAEQAQLHGARMQTFIIEQQAFIIHTSGFPRPPKINYEPPLHTLRSLMLRHRRRWIFSRLCWQELRLIYFVKKKHSWQIALWVVSRPPDRWSWVVAISACQGRFWRHRLTAAERLGESQHAQSVCAYFRLGIFHAVAPAARLKWALNWFQLHV